MTVTGETSSESDSDSEKFFVNMEVIFCKCEICIHLLFCLLVYMMLKLCLNNKNKNVFGPLCTVYYNTYYNRYY